MVDGFGYFFVDDEFGHGVGDSVGRGWSAWSLCTLAVKKGEIWQQGERWVSNSLFEQNRPEAGVECSDPLLARDLAKPANEPVREGGLGNEADPRRLERAQSDIGEELGQGGRGQVDGGAVVGGGLVAQVVDALLLEELVSSELEGALQKIPRGGGAEAGQKCAGAFSCDDLAEATDHAFVVGDGIELYSCLDTKGRGRGLALGLRH